MKAAPWLLAHPDELAAGGLVELDPSEARHVWGALRLRVGQEVVLADGSGKVAAATVVGINKKSVDVEVLSVEDCPLPTGRGVTLAVAVVGNQAMDWAVQKAVEVGVRVFVPLLSERSQLAKRDFAAQLARWRRVARQSLKQCRRPWAMGVLDVRHMTEFVDAEASVAGAVVADPEGCAAAELPPQTGRLLLIGPEGGFSPSELGLFERLGWPRLRLGPHVLRTETAVAVGGAILVARDEERIKSPHISHRIDSGR